jgi:hypothetical protein
MPDTNFSQEQKHTHRPRSKEQDSSQAGQPGGESSAENVQRLQRRLGNRAVQRALAQRSSAGEGRLAVDKEIEQRITSQRGGGQPLDTGVQQQMQDVIGYDLSGVRVHTSPEASSLSQSLQAKAFTTGSDVFFNEGQYQPTTSGGKELIAHELTHVAQQGSGQVSSSSGSMTVNAPNDVYEQQADAVARQAAGAPAAAAQAPVAQREALPEEDELQTKMLDSALQREGLPEEEELQASRLQKQELDEDEMVA